MIIAYCIFIPILLFISGFAKAIMDCKSNVVLSAGDYCRPTSDGSGLIELFPMEKIDAIANTPVGHPIWEVVSQDDSIDLITHMRLVNQFYSAFEDIYSVSSSSS